jgi:hypothetical protein
MEAQMRIIATLITIAGLLAGGTAAANDEDRSQELWEEFREAYPYHVQVAAVSAFNAAGRRSPILSESPLHASPASILAHESELAKATAEIKPRARAQAFPELAPNAVSPKPASVALAGDLEQLGVPSLVIERTPAGTYRVHAASETPLTASSYVSLSDMAYAAMKGRAQVNKPFQLHFMGFSESEASAFLKTMEVKFARDERPVLAGITPGGRTASVDVARALRIRPDFQSARVTEIVRMTQSSRPGLHEVRATVELPWTQAGRPSLFLRLQMFFRDLVVEPSREAVLSVVRRAFGAGENTTAKVNTSVAVMAIKRELKALHPSIEDVTIRYQSDAGDLLIIRLDEDDAPWTSRDNRSSLASAH